MEWAWERKLCNGNVERTDSCSFNYHYDKLPGKKYIRPSSIAEIEGIPVILLSLNIMHSRQDSSSGGSSSSSSSSSSNSSSSGSGSYSDDNTNTSKVNFIKCLFKIAKYPSS